MPNEIVFSWIEPTNNFDPINDYKIYWDVGRGDTLFDLLTASTFGQLEWTKDNSQMPELMPGSFY